MAVSELYACDACDFDVVLIHAQEWQDGPEGKPQPYPGWGTIGGLWNCLWCSQCRTAQPHVFLRLSPPATHAVVAFAEAQRLGATGKETGPCPVCANPLTWQVEGEACPRCTSGRLRLTGEWEDGW